MALFVRKSLVLALATISVSYFAVSEGERRLACLPEAPVVSAVDFATFPLQGDLFAHIENVETKRNAQNYYQWLSQIELESLQMQQRARSAYGLKGPLFASPSPISIASFNPLMPQSYSYVAKSTTWSFLGDPALTKLFPGISVSMVSLPTPSLMARPNAPVGPVQGASPFLVRHRF